MQRFVYSHQRACVYKVTAEAQTPRTLSLSFQAEDGEHVLRLTFRGNVPRPPNSLEVIIGRDGLTRIVETCNGYEQKPIASLVSNDTGYFERLLRAKRALSLLAGRLQDVSMRELERLYPSIESIAGILDIHLPEARCADGRLFAGAIGKPAKPVDGRG